MQMRRLGRCGLGLRRWRCLQLRLLALRLLGAGVARFILAAAPAAAMPLRLTLAVCRARPHFWLGLRWFCRHTCTSWHILLDGLLFRRCHEGAALLFNFSPHRVGNRSKRDDRSCEAPGVELHANTQRRSGVCFNREPPTSISLMC